MSLRSAIADAIRFLKEQPADGGRLKGDLDADARGDGINPATLHRAKTRKSERKPNLDLNGWRLPAIQQSLD